MKRKLARQLARNGIGWSALVACAMLANQASAVPYASQIRFAETEIVQALGTDLLYTLNEDCDAVTVEVYNATTDTVVRTYSFTSPAPETTVGRHAIAWDNRDEANNLLPIGSDELTIRVRVQKVDNSTEWTRLTGNSSTFTTKATEKKSIFAGFSSNDINIPQDPTSEQFGLVFASHSLGANPPAGFVVFGTDLEPLLGNGGGPENIRGRHPNPAGTGTDTVAVWRLAQDFIDPNLVWYAGQSLPARLGVFNTSGLNPIDIEEVSNPVWDTTSFPRDVAVWADPMTSERVAYVTMNSNTVVRAVLGSTFPHAVESFETLTVPEDPLDGITLQYGLAIELDNEGNLYFQTRSTTMAGATTADQGRLFRWSKADVDAAPGIPLVAVANPPEPIPGNAEWIVRSPATTTNLTALHIDRLTGEVYMGSANGNPRGVFLVGNVSDDLGVHQMSGDELILDYNDTSIFPGQFASTGSTLGHGVRTDWKGNIYVTARPQEEIHSFSPPGNGAEYDITTSSPTGYSASVLFDQTNLVFVDSTNTEPDGVGTFNSLREALLSFGPGGQNNGFPGMNRIEILNFGPFDEELPDLSAAFDADDFEFVSPNGPVLVLQQGSTWEISSNATIDGLVVASSLTNTPSGALVSSTGGTQTITNSWITALPAGATSYTSVADIPAAVVGGAGSFNASYVSADTGLAIAGGAITAENLIVSQNGEGISLTAGSLILDSSKVVSNDGTGIAASAGGVTIGDASEVSFNSGAGIAASGSSDLTLDSTFDNPNQVRGNGAAGLAHSSSVSYVVRNTLFNANDIGIDILSGSAAVAFGDYSVSDVIISESTTAGIRIADNIGFSSARVTLFDNTVGVLDLAPRSGFWALEFQDSIFAGSGDTGIASPGAGDSSIRMDHSAFVTEGPHALATDTTAPANAVLADVPVLNNDPQFQSVTYSTTRRLPDVYLAPSSLTGYLGGASPEGFDEGSNYRNLAGGSRWRVPFVATADTIFETNFETDQTANFTISESIPGDNPVDFQYDYSTFSQAAGGFPASIPPSPWGTGTGTRGVRMATNVAGGALNGVTATLNSVPGQSAMKITIDSWQNFASALSTENFTFGASGDSSLVAMSGGNYFTSPNSPFQGFFFSATTEGGQAQDFRYYDGNGGFEGALGNNAERANFLDIAAVDSLSFGSVFSPPQFPGIGWPGKAWLRWEIDLFAGHVRLHVTRPDGQRILLCDWFPMNDGTTIENLLPHFGTQDLFVSLASPASDQFVLIDYLRVQVIEQGEEIVIPPTELGDINGDGIINVADVTALAEAIVNNTLPTNEIGDVNNDGTINFDDVEALADLIVNP